MPESRRQWRRYKCDNLLGKSRSLSNNRGMAARKGWDEVVRKTSPETAVSLIHRFLRSPRPISLYFRPLPQFSSPYLRSAFPLEQRNIHRAVLLSYGSPSFLFLFHSPTCSALRASSTRPRKTFQSSRRAKAGVQSNARALTRHGRVFHRTSSCPMYLPGVARGPFVIPTKDGYSCLV